MEPNTRAGAARRKRSEQPAARVLNTRASLLLLNLPAMRAGDQEPCHFEIARRSPVASWRAAESCTQKQALRRPALVVQAIVSHKTAAQGGPPGKRAGVIYDASHVVVRTVQT